jgi:hypothetical protein
MLNMGQERPAPAWVIVKPGTLTQSWLHKISAVTRPKSSDGGVLGCRSRRLRTRSHESLLEQLDERYWGEGFDAAGAELTRLPPHFDQATVEDALNNRISCLEASPFFRRSLYVSTRLDPQSSKHPL